MKVARYAPVKFRWRFSVGFHTIAWALAPLTLFYTLGHLVYGFSPQTWVVLLADLAVGCSATIYLLGLRANLDEHGITNPALRLWWYIVQLVLWPVYAIMETSGALAAILKPVDGFRVVKK